MMPTDKKIVPVVYPAAIVDNASPTTVVIDTQGFRFLEVYVHFGAMDIAVTAMKLQESDTTTDANTLSSGADITGLIFGTSTNSGGSTSSLPSATDDNKFFKFEVDLRGRKRYIDLALTCGDGSAGTYVTAWGVLSLPEVAPVSASEKGCSQVLAV